jgi:hypothetical protein
MYDENFHKLNTLRSNDIDSNHGPDPLLWEFSTVLHKTVNTFNDICMEELIIWFEKDMKI